MDIGKEGLVENSTRYKYKIYLGTFFQLSFTDFMFVHKYSSNFSDSILPTILNIRIVTESCLNFYQHFSDDLIVLQFEHSHSSD